MSPRRWWRRRRREKLREKAAEANQQEPLREFVYLDDVSVYSLLASRIGALATDFTDSESSSLSTEVSAGGGVATPVAKAQASSAVKASATSGAQVLRKATVQSTFRELYGYIRHGLVMSVAPEGDIPKVTSISDLRAEAARRSPWVIGSEQLARGEVLEVEVALDADNTFRASTILSTLIGFMQELPQLPSTVDRQSFGDAITGMRLLDGLLDGVVPVRGRALHYQLVTVGGEEFVAHRLIAEQLSAPDAVMPLTIVGLCEVELFWRDLRRVLFASSQFRMLCRVGVSGTVQEWRPVKLADVLEGVVPGFKGIIDGIPSLLSQAREQEADHAPVDPALAALTNYAVDLCSQYGHNVSEDELRDRGLLKGFEGVEIEGVKERRAVFDNLTASLASEFGFVADPVVATRLRTASVIESHVIDLSVVPVPTDPPSRTPARERFLECEVVAIYW